MSDCWDTSSRSETFRNETSTVTSFIDKSGMVWRIRAVDGDGSGTPTILVDTNGNKKPNKYGQDRFPLYFSNTPDNNIAIADGAITGIPTKIVPQLDQLDNSSSTCPSYATHPCYYTTWLYN